MFERYTERARRVIFFARYEASQFGSPYIESEHLLLGLMREDKALTNRFLRTHARVETIRKQIEEHATVREKVSTSVDLPLSNESKRVLAYAAEEAEKLGHKHIGTEHLLLGLLREEKCFAAEILKERGVKLKAVREELASTPHSAEAESTPGPAQLGDISPSFSAVSRDLTQEAVDGQLDPVVGRDRELDAVVEILSSRNRRNPVLIGERGVGKRAIVEGLAQRIADGVAPSSLADKRIRSIEPQHMAGWARVRQASAEAASSVPGVSLRQRLSQIIEGQQEHDVQALAKGSEAILFLDELRTLFAASQSSRLPSGAEIMRSALLRGEMQCIAACTPSEYVTLTQAAPWLADLFRPLHVRPMDEEETLRVLQARKAQFERFHAVTYTDEALVCAARCSGGYLVGTPLPGKALELLDAAGARVKLRQTALPDEVAEVQKRIKFIAHRMDSAIASHEFEKAKFYSEEERKERENLRNLREKYKLDDSALSIVSREDVEERIARWGEYPFRP